MSVRQRFLESQSTTSVLHACGRAARKYLSDHGSRLQPVNLEAFAREHGITIQEDPSLRAEGMLERGAAGQATIRLRPFASARRRRFTLAHEIGHWILQEEMSDLPRDDRNRPFWGLSRGPEEIQEEEKLANLLAAELLLPRRAVEEVAGSKSLLAAVRELCRTYFVSRVAAIRRIADLGGRDLLFVELIPRRFHNLATPAEVDDAVLARAGNATVYTRERTRLINSVPFETLARSKRMTLHFETMFEDVHTEFELDSAMRPIPHVYGLASLEQGWEG